MPQRKLSIPFTGGHNSKRDPGFVGVNQLVKSQGAEYREGDSELIHKIPGRTLYGDVASVQRIKGLVLATYDDGTEFLLAVGGTTLYYSDASNATTGTFTAMTGSGATDRSASTNRVSAAHFDDRWYVASGFSQNSVVESDATVVQHGMRGPLRQRITVSAVSVGVNEVRPDGTDGALVTATHSDGDWANTDHATDGEFTREFLGFKPYASALLNAEDQEARIEWEFTASDFGSKFLEVVFWAGDAVHFFTSGDADDDSDKPGNSEEWTLQLRVRVSTNDGVGWTTELQNFKRKSYEGVQTLQIPLEDSVTLNQVHVDLRISATRLVEPDILTVHVYDVRMFDAPNVTTITTSGSLYYAFTEYDEDRDWESALSAPTRLDAGTGLVSVDVSNFPAKVNDNATHYRIYRTSDNNTDLDRSELGLVGQIETSRTLQNNGTFRDTFQVFAVDQSPLPLYEFLILDEFGVKSYYDINQPPPALSWIGSFGGALFGLKGRTYHQSVPGRSHQWPTLFAIDRMPFRTNSPLVCGYQIGETLWIGGKDGVILLDHPIETRTGQLRVPTPRRLEGAPGVTGEYAATPLHFNGESLVAWVSLHGIYVSNLASFSRITLDIDWEGNLSESNLETAVLFWREKKEQLVLAYDSDADGKNDKYALIHMSPDLRTEQGRPLITWGHAGNISHWVGGRLAGKWVEFTGNSGVDSGRGNEVYVEGGTVSDASDSHNTASDIPLDIQTGRQYFDQDVETVKSRLFCTAPSTTITLTVGYTTGRDDEIADRTQESILSWSGADSRSSWKYFNVQQAGEFMQWRIQHTGQASFALGPMEPMVEGQDETGDLD